MATTKKASAKKPSAKASAKKASKTTEAKTKAPKKASKSASAAASTPKLTEKVSKKAAPKKTETPESMDACHVTGKCTSWGCSGGCSCCKWVAFLYILLAIALAVSLTKHVFYYNAYKNGGWDKGGKCMSQQQVPQAPTAPEAPAVQ